MRNRNRHSKNWSGERRVGRVSGVRRSPHTGRGVNAMSVNAEKCDTSTQPQPLLLTLVVCRGCQKRLGAVLIGAKVWCPVCHVWTTAATTTKPIKDAAR